MVAGSSALAKTGVELVIEGLAGFRSGMAGAQNLLDKFGKRAEDSSRGVSIFNKAFDAVGDTILRVGEIAAGILAAQVFGRIASGISNMVGEAIRAGAEFQQLSIRLEGLLARDIAVDQAIPFADALKQAVPVAKDLFFWIQKLALTTPFDIKNVANTITLAKSYGFATDKAKELTSATVDFASGMGLGNLEMTRIIENLGQMVQQGKITGTELRDLGRGAFLPINRLLDMTAENLGITTDELKKLRDKGVAPVEPFIQAFIDLVGTDFPNAGRRASRTVAAVKGNFQDLIQGVLGFNVVKPVLDSIAGLGADIIDALTLGDRGDKVLALAERIGIAFSGITESLLELLPPADKIGDAIVGVMERVTKFLEENLPIAIDNLKAIFSGEAFGEIKIPDSLQTFIDRLVSGFQTLKEFWDENGEAITNAILQIGESIATMAEAGAITILELLGTTFTDIADTIKENGPQITTIIQSIADFISDDLVPAFISVSDWIVNNRDLILKFFVAFKIAGIILSALIKVIGFLITAFLIFQTIILFPIIALIGGLILIVAGAALAFIAFKDKVKEAIDKIKNAIANIDWKQVGKNIINAIKDGVSSAAGALARTAATVALNAFNAMKEILGISSPSTLFEGLGKNVVAGFAKGIAEQADMAKSAMQMAVTHTIAPAARAVAIAPSVASQATTNNNFNMTIHSGASFEPIIQDFELMKSFVG